MSEKYVPISQHNANYYKLDQVCDDLQEPLDLSAPVYQDQIILMGLQKPTAKIWPVRATITIAPYHDLESSKGFVATRTDEGGDLIQAQDVKKPETFPPFGRKIFKDPIPELIVARHDDSNAWRINVDPYNVTDRVGLNFLVWALANYTRSRQEAAADSAEITEKKPA